MKDKSVFLVSDRFSIDLAESYRPIVKAILFEMFLLVSF